MLSKLIDTIGNVFKSIIKVVITFAIFLLIIWVFNHANDTMREMFFSTKEKSYETQITTKAKQLLDVLFKSDQYLIFTSVKFRDKTEKIQQSVKSPKEIDHTDVKSTVLESKKEPKKQSLKVEKGETIDLPGMEDLFSSTNRYVMQEEKVVEEMFSESEKVEQTSKQIYFNEKTIEVSYNKSSIDYIRVTIYIDPLLLTKVNLNELEVRSYLIDVLPLDFSRGDEIVVRAFEVNLEETFLQKIETLLVERVFTPIYNFIQAVSSWFNKYWETLVMIVSGVIGALAIYFLGRFISRVLARRKQRKDELKQKEKEEEQNARLADEPVTLPEVPDDYVKGVLVAVKNNEKEASEVLNYWMGMYNEQEK